VKNGRRVWLTPAYVLHQYAYRDTSRIIEIVTQEFGRLSLFARGARGPKSPWRATLRPFQKLLVSWYGRTEAGQLTAAEIDGGVTELPPGRLMSGFYLNELLLKLTERWDPHPRIFNQYEAALSALASGNGEERSLRLFEKRLLEELGYGLDFSATDAHQPIQPEYHYRVRPQGAVSRCDATAPGAMAGSTLIDFAIEAFEDAGTLRDAKRILRAAIEACLEGRPLGSREVMMALHRREQQ
jgi:DNA repair protein RecO (recombination protein O)